MASDKTAHLSIVIPAYNEASRLPPSLEKLARYIDTVGLSCEVLVMVERGTDATLERAREVVKNRIDFEVIDNQVHRGKGYAVKSGMLRAEGDIALFMDADLSVPLEFISVFLDYFDKHPEVDVLIGNRQHAQSNIVKAQGVLRRNMGKIFNLIVNSTGANLPRDTQCGFKAFRKPAAKAVFSRQQMDGFSFDVEALLLAHRLGYKIVDLPVDWINSTDTRVSIVQDSLKMFRDVLRVNRVVSKTLQKEK